MFVDVLYRLVRYWVVGRVLEFDRSSTLDKALVLFWSKGYQAASLAELLEAMQISRSSFYATFGDKRSLCVECLDIFASRTRDILHRARKEHAPLMALRKFFEYTATGQRASRTAWG
jgi:TetR/AcrR family transcriptional regulator, transcriptional repressor for nem operon